MLMASSASQLVKRVPELLHNNLLLREMHAAIQTQQVRAFCRLGPFAHCKRPRGYRAAVWIGEAIHPQQLIANKSRAHAQPAVWRPADSHIQVELVNA